MGIKWDGLEDETSFSVPLISACNNMKVLALVIFAVASVSSKGSGPYLPSGWRPQGPAFYLPSEVQKPVENPLKDTILNESEASGSDALREYGPPKVVEVSQDLTRQALPEAVTEQAFVAIEAKFTEVNGEVKEESEVRSIEEVKEITVTEDAVEVTTEQNATEAITEAIDDKTTEAIPQGRAIDIQTIEGTVEIQDATTERVEITTANVVEVKAVAEAVVDSNVESTQVEQVSQEKEVSQIQDVSQAEVKAVVDSNVESTQVEQVSQEKEVSQIQDVSQAEVKAVVDSNVESTQVEQVSQEQEVNQIQDISQAEVKTVEGAKNVVEALERLEKDIKTQQIQSNEEAIDVKSVQVLGSAEQAPEGFLEYGPPGFKEYGPPQADELFRSEDIVQEPSEEEKVENNETRRRRFSPKFRPSQKH